MDIEHVALNVADPAAAAAWYVAHLGMRIVRRAGGPTNTHFIGDSSGRVVLDVGTSFEARTLLEPNTPNSFTSNDLLFSYLQVGLPLRRNWYAKPAIASYWLL